MFLETKAFKVGECKDPGPEDGVMQGHSGPRAVKRAKAMAQEPNFHEVQREDVDGIKESTFHLSEPGKPTSHISVDFVFQLARRVQDSGKLKFFRLFRSPFMTAASFGECGINSIEYQFSRTQKSKHFTKLNEFT